MCPSQTPSFPSSSILGLQTGGTGPCAPGPHSLGGKRHKHTLLGFVHFVSSVVPPPCDSDTAVSPLIPPSSLRLGGCPARALVTAGKRQRTRSEAQLHGAFPAHVLSHRAQTPAWSYGLSALRVPDCSQEQFRGTPVGLWQRRVIVIVVVTLVCWLDWPEGRLQSWHRISGCVWKRLALNQ